MIVTFYITTVIQLDIKPSFQCRLARALTQFLVGLALGGGAKPKRGLSLGDIYSL